MKIAYVGYFLQQIALRGAYIWLSCIYGVGKKKIKMSYNKPKAKFHPGSEIIYELHIQHQRVSFSSRCPKFYFLGLDGVAGFRIPIPHSHPCLTPGAADSLPSSFGKKRASPTRRRVVLCIDKQNDNSLWFIFEEKLHFIRGVLYICHKLNMCMKPTYIFRERQTVFQPGEGGSSREEGVVVFSGVVCVSCTGDEGFQPKDLEVLRSTRASVERHSCSDHTLLCPILLKQDLLSAVQILYASFSAFRFIPLSVEFKLWHSLSASALGRRSDCR